MKTRVKGLYAAEDLIGIAQRLMARLQDAGVTHVRDVSVYYTTTDAKGDAVEVGTIAGPVDELSLETSDMALAFPERRLEVLRPQPGRKPKLRVVPERKRDRQS